MIFKRVDHVEIVPKRAEETIDFYVNILNFKIRSRSEVKVPPMKEVIISNWAIQSLRLLARMIPSQNPRMPGK